MSNQQIGGAKTTYSNDEGFFRLVSIYPALVTVKASLPKLKPLQIQVTVTAGKTAAITLVMQVEPSGNRNESWE